MSYKLSGTTVLIQKVHNATAALEISYTCNLIKVITKLKLIK